MNWVRVAVLISPAVFASAQPRAAFDKNELGLKAAYAGDYTTAERLYQESIAIWKQSGDRYLAHLATTELNLAQALCAQGKRKEGASYLSESLAHFRPSLGPRDLRTLTAMNLLAGVQLMLGENEQARALFEEALPIERELYPNDVQLGRSLIGLAGVEMQHSRYAEALPPAEEGLRVVLKALGEASADAALAYATVAEIHRGAGRPDRALPLFRKARAIYEKEVGAEHPRVASILAQEGLVLMALGKESTAEAQLLRALRMLDTHCPDCVSEKYVAETNLALLRSRQGKYAQADSLLSDALSLEERYRNIPGADLAATLRALAWVRQKERRFEDAEQLARRADAVLSLR